jgi:RNA polymerase sigma-70 factor (ECF subfamily)
MMDNPKIYVDGDTRLMLKAAYGDETAYVKLYKKYFPILVNYAARLNGYQTSPEDIAQEVFVRIWEHRAKYRPYSTVKTYLFVA